MDSNATFEEVKSTYRKLVLELHPDKNTRNKDDGQFKKITEAYHVLKFNREYSTKSSKKMYTDSSTKSDHTFSQKKSKWGDAFAEEKTPEEDWSKYTKDFEEENPSFWKQYEKKFWQEYDQYLEKDAKNGEFDKTLDPKNPPDLNIEVDPSLCIACCSCETIAPEVFEIDDSRMNPKSHVINPKGAGFNRIMSAAETCPTKAIKVENKETKERLYPW